MIPLFAKIKTKASMKYFIYQKEIFWIIKILWAFYFIKKICFLAFYHLKMVLVELY